MGVATAPELVLLSRPGCHLCDVMESMLQDVLPQFGLAYRKIDVDSDEALRETYGETVPVLLWCGRELARVRLSRPRLEALLTPSG